MFSSYQTQRFGAAVWRGGLARRFGTDVWLLRGELRRGP